jgi:4-diphosphocytidyl-2-C-methyl-D-erythritol kinase
MVVRRTSSGFQIWAPAKLNLFLEVLGKRADGFHELETLMVPVNLYDTLELRDDPSGNLTLHCPMASSFEPPSPPLPTGTDNLVIRALERARQAWGVDSGANVRLFKRIPVAAGLAGGSSDAAAALMAANLLWRAGRTTEEIARLAAELGSDVPFFLAGGAAVCRGRGEQVEPVSCPARGHFVVLSPNQGLSTADVFRACRPATCPGSALEVRDALRAGRWGDLARGLFNRLSEPARELCPAIGDALHALARSGAVGTLMSGSGTSCFGVCRSAGHALRVAGRVRAIHRGRVFAVAS